MPDKILRIASLFIIEHFHISSLYSCSPSCQNRNIYLYFWRRKWQLTPAFVPGESHEQRNLVGHSPWGHRELDTTIVTLHTCMNLGRAKIYSLSHFQICNATLVAIVLLCVTFSGLFFLISFFIYGCIRSSLQPAGFSLV